MIYTSYFGKLKKLPKDIVPISICGKAPDWYKGIQYRVLAPKWDFFKVWKENHDNDYYIRCFKAQVLDQLNPDAVVNRLNVLSEGKDIALLCYERPLDFCHRHLVASWLRRNGYESHEWRENNEDE